MKALLFLLFEGVRTLFVVGWSGSSATYLSSSSGLITTSTYGSSTTATSSTAGNVAGYLEQTAIEQGTGGTSIPQESYTYISNTVGSATVYETATDTVYQSTGGSGAETTSYAYTLYSGTNAITQLPFTPSWPASGPGGSRFRIPSDRCIP